MKQALKNLSTRAKTWHFVDGEKVAGIPPSLRGDVTGLFGDVTGLRGTVTGLRGDVTGLVGDATDLSGDVDNCEITEDDRARGVAIEDLIANLD